MRIRRKSDRLQGSDGTRLIVAMPAGPDPPRVAIKTHIDRQLPSLWPLLTAALRLCGATRTDHVRPTCVISASRALSR